VYLSLVGSTPTLSAKTSHRKPYHCWKAQAFTV